jgi:hypothetical protein
MSSTDSLIFERHALRIVLGEPLLGRFLAGENLQ